MAQVEIQGARLNYQFLFSPEELSNYALGLFST